ncbi:MAG: 1-acyl-sn-glycerol-3-phosphate acyltransferase [Solirubrobacteraceae bacterium MAG38_C4-C5]|nr:1-acyl-sn-glycerol-3-phosphate acyltransferase [Candidatus Siliceabacter maunaloa]
MGEDVAPGCNEGATCAQLDLPWARSPPARAAREVILRGVFNGLLAYYTRRRTTGEQRLYDEATPPVLFVANHSSHMDTPLILCALPARWRRRTAVAAAADYFYGDRRLAALVSLAFNTVPVRRKGGGIASLEHIEALLADRWSLLLYPQGTRSREGDTGRLRSGAAVLAAQHQLAIVPIRVEGTHAAMPPGQSWPRRRVWRRRHPVAVTFGEAIRPRSPHERDQAMERLQAFFAGREPVPAPRGAAIAPDLAFPYASAMPSPAALDERRPQL